MSQSLSSSTLVVEGLVFGRGGFRAGPVSFAAPPGAFVALIGPNGGGKTTLLKTLAGLLPALAGTVTIDAGPARSRTAYLPPPGALAADMPTEHVVALGRAARRGWSPVLGPADMDAARSALARLGIADLASRSFDRISSGQQQLALIARLLVQDARLCLLDEPTTLLDPPHAARVEHAIRLLCAEGRVVVASTHHLPFASRAGLVVAVGKSVRVGEPAGMLTAPALSALYGSDVALCPCCGQPIAEVISA